MPVNIEEIERDLRDARDLMRSAREVMALARGPLSEALLILGLFRRGYAFLTIWRPAVLRTRRDIRRRELFDERYYLSANPPELVAKAQGRAFSHYLGWGWRTGCNPHPLFDTRFYLAQRPDLLAHAVNPL